MIDRKFDLFSFVGCSVVVYPYIEILIGVEKANVAKWVVIVLLFFVLIGVVL